MRKMLYVILALAIAVWFGQLSYAGEHGGVEETDKEHAGVEETDKEHAGVEETDKEHGGAPVSKEPTVEDIRQTMKNYVIDESAESGSFDIYDEETGQTRRLELVRVHERVGKTGDYYYSCADFNDTDSGELLDLDLDVEDKDGDLSVVDVRIHKLSGKERYTYDENDNRIPISE